MNGGARWPDCATGWHDRCTHPGRCGCPCHGRKVTRVGPPPEPVTFRLDETIRYDREQGELQVLVDGIVREAMQVRTALVDGVLLEAIVAELQRRGYTVTPPGADR